MDVVTDFGTFEVGSSVVYRARGDPEDHPGTVQLDGVEVTGNHRLVLQDQDRPVLITWPWVEHMMPAAVAHNGRYTAGQEVRDILEGRGYYGGVRGELQRTAPGVYFHGSPGISASVGPWMREVWQRFTAGTPISGVWAYYSREDRELDHNLWYFAVALANEIHVVGGCTDFSGEGGRAKRLAEEFLERLPFEPTIRPASNLVDLLVEGYGPYILSREEASDGDEGDHNT